LTKSAADGDVLCVNEVSEGRVRVVAGERAVGAGGVAVLVIVRRIAVLGDVSRHTQRLIKTSSSGSQVLTSITPMSSSNGMPT
jgi:uncharacterized membrane-anchored protein